MASEQKLSSDASVSREGSRVSVEAQRTVLGWRGWQVESPKSCISVEWSAWLSGWGPLGLPIPGLGCSASQRQLFSRHLSPILVSLPSPFTHCLPRPGMTQAFQALSQDLFRASILCSSRGVTAHDEIREGLGRKYDEQGQSQGGNMHVFICLPRTGCFLTTFHNPNSMFLLSIL